MNHKSNMNVGGESHGRVVPAKCPNKDGKPSAEGAEGRRPTKENTGQTTASQTQSWGDALSGLHRVREAAGKDKRLRFTALTPCHRSPTSEQFLCVEEGSCTGSRRCDVER